MQGHAPEDLAGWATRRQWDIHHGAREAVGRHARSSAQRAALDAIVTQLKPERLFLAPYLLPLLVHAAIRGEDGEALPAAVAVALFQYGVGIQDDLLDGDRPAWWGNSSPAEMNLAAADLLVSLPQLVLSELPAPAATIATLQRTLALGYLRTSAGQRMDLLLTGAETASAAQVERCAAAKGGAGVEMAALLGAQLARATPQQAKAYAAFGQAAGAARSLSEDCEELFLLGRDSDLLAGTRSFPLAVYLGRRRGGRRHAFLALLERARHDPAAREEVRQLLVAGGVVRYCTLVIGSLCEEARMALARANPLEPAGAMLEAFINRLSSLVEARPTTGEGRASLLP